MPVTLHSRLQRHAGLLFLLIAISVAAAALMARGLTALTTRELLDWDETYYASTTATAAHGLGLYPYVLGYPPIPNMGGVGHVVALYVLAYKLLGPDLIALRLVGFLVSLAAVAGLCVLTRQLYGSAAGIAALALTPSLLLFQLSNTIRLDVFAIAFVAWALVLYAHVVDRKTIGSHALVGFVFAIGLQVHLHTVAAAFAVGVACLVSSAAGLRRRAGRDAGWIKPLAGFVTGYALGALLFVAVSIAPNPTGFFRTAALARLSAAESGTNLNLTARLDRSRLAQTFLSPTVILRKEGDRYRSLVRDMSLWERFLWVWALPAFFVFRRTARAFRVRTLLAGAVVGGGIIFNSSSPLYASAILPFFIPAAATIVTHGFRGTPRVDRAEVSLVSVAVLLVFAIAVLPAALSRTGQGFTQLRHTGAPKPTPPGVDVIRNTVSRDCILAGPTDLYAEYFMAYPKFVGTRKVEVLIGSTYYDLQDRLVDYWSSKRPDVVFGDPDEALRTYLSQAKYVTMAEGVWRKPAALSPGCSIEDGRPSTAQTGT